MRIAIHNHQNKARGLAAGLHKLGHELVNIDPDVLLIDHTAHPYYSSIIDKHIAQGVKVLLYSHGAQSCIAWDGIWELDKRISGYLAMSAGEAQIMDAYGFPLPVHVVGWHWCEQKPFAPAPDNPSVLYAPIHPLGNGHIRAEVKAENKRVYEELIKQGVRLTVRTIGNPEHSGVDPAPSVTVDVGRSDLQNAIDAIDAHDLIVSYGTFAYLAVARGKPAIMYGQELHPAAWTPEGVRYAASWHRYCSEWDYDHRFPIKRTLERAAQEEDVYWRDQFIGSNLDLEVLNNALLHLS